MYDFCLKWPWKQLQLINLVVFLHMSAWICLFLLFKLCLVFLNYHFINVAWKKVFCPKKHITYDIFVSKKHTAFLSRKYYHTYALPKQILVEITQIFTYLKFGKYRDLLHHLKYREKKEQYCSGVTPSTLCPSQTLAWHFWRAGPPKWGG